MLPVYSAMKKTVVSMLTGLLLGLLFLPSLSLAETASPADTASFRASAELIRRTYEPELFTLPNSRVAHWGLRMYRQNLNDRYRSSVGIDLLRIANRLNYFAAEVHTPEQIARYSQQAMKFYENSENIRSKRRFRATQSTPEYLYIIKLLAVMARADEYGLKHREHAKFQEVLSRYDMRPYVTDKKMIRAWAAQMANQVFWLRQVGGQDVVDSFIQAFRETYPDAKDASLSTQQYGNKIYGMTHIIFAESEFYMHKIDEAQHQWVFDYFRENIDTILQRAKPDIVAEVGISFLLAGLNDDPVVFKTQKFIQSHINVERGMIPSVKGEFDLFSGGHRNVLAVMLLDWWSVNEAPIVTRHRRVFINLPYGLVKQ